MTTKKLSAVMVAVTSLSLLGALVLSGSVGAAPAQKPLFLGGGQPLVMLTMGRDHKLYYEAYNDASDINGDGILDVGFKPAIDYYGYFDSYKCYVYDSGNGRFTPDSVTVDKKCSGKWSGNWLNYITMTRMDAMRKVLYGGYRSTEGDTLTILERSYVPQDAHSWGKEYESEARDGYKITDYTPLAQPFPGKRHLIANTTLLSPPTGQDGPLMRVATNSSYRVWEWVSIERPVAGDDCKNATTNRQSCVGPDPFSTTGASPSNGLSGLTQTTYRTTNNTNYPADTAEFNTLQNLFATATYRCGSQAVATIDGSGNPFAGSNGCTSDNYMTIFAGTLNVSTSGTYDFAVDGDDSVDLIIDGAVVASWYGAHGNCNCNDHTGSVNLTAGAHAIMFRHREVGGGDNYYLRWRPSAPKTMTNYKVRVEVCKPGLLESDCKGYPVGSATPAVYRPTGLLHEFGEDHTMAFGLLTGSYTNNLQGGVLRKNIDNFGGEVDQTSGKFTTIDGIVKTLNTLSVVDFGAGGEYQYGCPGAASAWITDRPLSNGICVMWGNPIGEMMYEGLRYFSGKTSPTADFTYSGSTDFGLNLPKPTWQNPYRSTSGGYGWCSKPFQLVISDINPSYDSDQVPGSAFSSFTGDLAGLDASALGQTIWNNEPHPSSAFIGQSGALYDGAPTAKPVSSFGNIRGLAPEEPTKQGSYYSASVAYFGNVNKITNPDGVAVSETAKRQNVQTFAVALASPLPRIQIPIASLGRTITFVPFAKSVAGGPTPTQGGFQPTNQIVDFYVDTIRNVDGFPADLSVNGGRPYYKFRINYEDVEQGADHDMDAIVEYAISLLADNTVQVVLNSTYAYGGIIQHIGYVVSGSTADGTYLVVKDLPDGENTPDVNYYLDYPSVPGALLGYSSTRVFVSGGASASFIPHDPLWYAAKWGGFTDVSGSKDNVPNVDAEWDKKNVSGALVSDGVPDNYYLVTNAGKLKDQLRAAFSEIAERVSSASAVAQNSTRVGNDSMIFQARFNTQDWTGQLRAFDIATGGVVDTSSPVWEASDKMPTASSRNIYTWNNQSNTGVLFNLGAGGLTAAQLTTLGLSSLSAAEQTKYINYLRGDSSYEQRNGGLFRNRSSSLGDIVNSDPVFVQGGDFGYEVLPEATATTTNSYVQFRDVTKPARRKMIYVSANDGFVHGFDASDSASGGVEQFAFNPAATHSQLKNLASPGYSHQYYVDGALFAGDAYFGVAPGGSWKTVLLGTTGAAVGKSVFALDVTNPDAFSANSVMWEFTHANLGYPMGQPVIARMPNGRWAAVFGNGYESSAGTAKLFIVYLNPDLSDGWTSGTDYCVLAADDAVSSNGLSTPSLVDMNGDGVIDYIYAGDIQGNLWKFAIDGTGTGSTDNCPTSKWKVDKKVFQTPSVTCRTKSANGTISTCTSPTSKRQPITSTVEVSTAQSGQSGGVMLFFGTGMYYQSTDVSDMTRQSFYGIWDDGTNSSVSLSDLVQQTIDTEDTVTINGVSYDYRLTSANPVDFASKKGWYMNLLKPNPDAGNPLYQGERVVSAPLLRGGRVIFTTLIPSTDACEFGGSSWIMEVDLASGSSPASSVFDLNGDGKFTSADMVGGKVVTGIKSKEGILKTPAVISDGSKEYKLSSGSTGNIVKITERGAQSVRRTSWRQIQ